MHQHRSSQQTDPHLALLAAISLAGSQGRLAEICGCTPPNIWQLVRRGSALPGRFVLAVEKGTGLSRHVLRPDLYPIEHTLCSMTTIAA
ncbi:YdaS family helix-turn-helix protein [Sphingomonas sp. LB2R24]|uniref:YdaS family helix-turn-helix protein n=1 Tax=Sphingomonas sorbitolis TaxID=3096165 RepID=UPI003FA7D98D